MTNLNLELYKKLYLVRKSEEAIIANYKDNEMRAPMHMSLGAEAIAVGVCHALGSKAQAFITYRSHAVYLAKSENTNDFFAELYGKETAPAKGKAGSMHLCDPGSGIMSASGIVASTIPVAVGAAFASREKGNGNFVAAFFGDAAVEEGVFWESVNVASLMKLPIIFVCEDNGLSVHTAPEERRGYASLTEIVSKFNCHVLQEETTDVEVIHALTRKAMHLFEETTMPVFLQLKYYRYLEHVGVHDDFYVGYRPKEAFEKWLKEKGDPLDVQKKKLLAGMNETEIMKVERIIDQKIQHSLELAKKAPFAPKDELYRGVFA